MKKLLIVLCGIVLSTIACKTKNAKGVVDESTSSKPAVASALDKILGSFVGTFGDNKIALLITKAVGDSVLGRTVVGGNDRPFAGTVQYANGVYAITAKEPGDQKNDGSFSFTVNETNLNQLEGSWASFANPAAVKQYNLQKRVFTYDVNVGDFAIASQRELKESDVESLSKENLELMRNAIFARHGYCFKKKEMRQAFEKEDWYVPNTTNVAPDLTSVERKNIALIKRYEQYYDEYGDEFGR